MYMQQQEMSTKKALLLLGVLIVPLVLSLIVPASWVGIEPTATTKKQINLSYSLKKNDIDLPHTWGELTNSTLDQASIKDLGSKKLTEAETSRLKDPNNLTVSFSKNLYVASTYLAKNPDNNATMQKEILDTLIAKEASKIKPTVFNYSDLTIAKQESKESIKAYGNTVAKLLNGIVTEKNMADDIGALYAYLETKDASKLPPLLKDADRVAELHKKLLAVSVPPSASIYHLTMINRVSAYVDTLVNLAMVQEDPVRATLFIDRYIESIATAVGSYKELSNYFLLQNIVFSQNEPGYVFTVGYTFK